MYLIHLNHLSLQQDALGRHDEDDVRIRIPIILYIIRTFHPLPFPLRIISHLHLHRHRLTKTKESSACLFLLASMRSLCLINVSALLWAILLLVARSIVVLICSEWLVSGTSSLATLSSLFLGVESAIEWVSVFGFSRETEEDWIELLCFDDDDDDNGVVSFSLLESWEADDSFGSKRSAGAGVVAKGEELIVRLVTGMGMGTFDVRVPIERDCLSLAAGVASGPSSAV